MADDRPVPFFIMGCPRSGTTLAAQILDGHSRLAVYLEMTYYGTFRPLLPLYGDLGRPGNRRRFIRDVLELVRLQRAAPPSIEAVEQALVAPTFEGILATLLGLHARSRGKARGGEKTPLNFKYLPEIRAGFPESPVLYLMRDPRDAVLSVRRVLDMSMREGIEFWNEAFARFTHAASPAVHLVRYEDLARDPSRITAEMCRALGESFEPEMLQSGGRLPDQLTQIRHLDLAKLSGPVVASSIGNFREMPATDIALIETECATGMEAMQYEFTTARRRAPAPLAHAPARGVHLKNRLRYYGFNAERWRRGMFRWRLVLRLRTRHLLTLRFLRSPRRSSASSARTLRAVRQQWEDIGAMDPLWGGLSAGDNKFGGWDEAELFATGERQIESLMNTIESLGRPARRARALDFGCGVGRLTRSLGARFEEALGVDISEAMVLKARELNADVDACEFTVNQEQDLRVLPDRHFDLAYSSIALQHVGSRRLIKAYVAELARTVREDGILVFGVLTHVPVWRRAKLRHRAYTGLRRLGVGRTLLYERLRLMPYTAVHIPEREVATLVDEIGGRVLRVEDDPVSRSGVQGRVFFVAP